jgi:hypothetical protein
MCVKPKDIDEELICDIGGEKYIVDMLEGVICQNDDCAFMYSPECLVNFKGRCPKCNSETSPLRKNDRKQIEKIKIKCNKGSCVNVTVKIADLKDHMKEFHLLDPTSNDEHTYYTESALKKHLKEKFLIVYEQKKNMSGQVSEEIKNMMLAHKAGRMKNEELEKLREEFH